METVGLGNTQLGCATVTTIGVVRGRKVNLRDRDKGAKVKSQTLMAWAQKGGLK